MQLFKDLSVPVTVETLSTVLNLGADLQARVFSSQAEAEDWVLQSKAPKISLPKQIHSNLIVSHPFLAGTEGDGIFALAHQKFSIGVYTADCLPVCFAWKNSNAAVVHAGWRGFAKGILKNAWDLFPERPSKVFVGPAIFGESYECGLEVLTALGQAGVTGIPTRGDKCYPDLQKAAVDFFLSVGMNPSEISVMRLNTYTTPQLPSYRRACHLQLGPEAKKGRMVTVLSNHKSSC